MGARKAAWTRFVLCLLVAVCALAVLGACSSGDGGASASGIQPSSPSAGSDSASLPDPQDRMSTAQQVASSSSDAAASQGLSSVDGAADSSGSPHGNSAEEALASMTLGQKVAQMFIVTGESLCSDGSTLLYVDDDVRSNLASVPVGGVSLLGSNLVDPEQASALASDLQAASRSLVGVDMLLCVDEEGGTVSRIGASPEFPEEDVGDMRAVGDAGDLQAASGIARTIGSYLLKYGFNVDFAPVADIDDPPGGTMHDRSFGSDAAIVSEMVVAQVEGFETAGAMSCVKHFPGIGSAAGDSHEESIATDKTLDELLASDLVPFQAAVDAGVPMVMVGHISCPNVTGDSVPATFSPVLIGDVLRSRMGFDGVVVTDSLLMDAAQEAYGDAEGCVRAIEAGADMLLMPLDFQQAYHGVMQALQEGRITEERIDESVERILKMKFAYAR